MPNVRDYILWRGDLSFSDQPFTVTDNLVLCQLAYIDMRSVFPSPVLTGEEWETKEHAGTGREPVMTVREAIMTVREAIEALQAQGGIDTLLTDGEQKREEYTEFALAAASSRRFGDLVMEDYVDIRDDELQTQFAAVTFRLAEDVRFIAFRGTDDSIIGWKEDFMISFTRVAAQDLALEYVQRHMKPRENNVSPDGCGSGATSLSQDPSSCVSTGTCGTGTSRPDRQNVSEEDSSLQNPSRRDPSRRDPSHALRFYIGGHSKGANLALYAAAMLPAELRTQLIHVYVNDGPGLCSDVIDPGLTASVDPITTKIVPEYDVIGKIFEMQITDNRIVRSSGEGILQHGIITWQLREGGALDLVPANAPGSVWIGEVLDKWIGGVKEEDRATFVNEFFAILGAGDVDTFTELGDMTPEMLERIIAQAAGTSPVTWDVAAALPRAATVGVGEKEHRSQLEYVRGLFRKGTYSRGLLLLGAGAACLLMPQRLLPLSINLVILAFLAYEVLYLVRRLRASSWNWRAVQIPFFILLFSLTAWFVVITKENLLMLLSNLVYGGIFLFLSYRSFARLNRENSSGSDRGLDPARIWNLAEGILLLLLALTMLIAPFDVVTVCTFLLGIVLACDGIAHLFSVYRKRKEATRKRPSCTPGRDQYGRRSPFG